VDKVGPAFSAACFFVVCSGRWAAAYQLTRDHLAGKVVWKLGDDIADICAEIQQAVG
jgi:hypothetical protein